MIRELRVSGFRILKNFVWEPKEGLNILVGANSAGKSTVLDAIELVTRGSLRGQNARRSLTPDWFNKGIVDAFFRELGGPLEDVNVPEIKIVAVFSEDRRLARITGANDPDKKLKDAPGIFITYAVPPNLLPQFLEECRGIKNAGGPFVLPTDYYDCSWRIFQGDSIVRRPEGVSCTRIDTAPEPRSRAVDAYAKSYVGEELDDDKMRKVTSQFRRVSAQVDREILASITVNCSGRGDLGIQMDRSPRTDWTNSIVLHRGGLPLYALGSAEQTLTKCAVSLENANSESILLLEEPECHLSYSWLNDLVGVIAGAASEDRQIFVTTHSPFVLNRLGLDCLSIMAEGNSPNRITSLSEDTVSYFKRLSGYDTLRIVLADRAVLVEGPTDELVFAWAFRKVRGKLPHEKGIDVIECGTSHKRLLELAAALEKGGIAALRDNDGDDPDYWAGLAERHLSNVRAFFCGALVEGKTIEPQMIEANKGKLQTLASIVRKRGDATDKLEEFMTNNKTEWALRLLEADRSESEVLDIPSYILNAINFIDPAPESAENE